MRTRKVLSLLLSVALVFGLVSIPAFAEDVKKPVFVLTADEIDDFVASPDGHPFLVKAGGVTVSNENGSLLVSGRTNNWEGVDLKKGAFTEGVEYTFIVEVHTDGTAYFQAGEGGGSYKRHASTAAVAEATLTFKLSTFGQNIRINTLDDSNKEDIYITSIVIWEGEPGELPVEGEEEDAGEEEGEEPSEDVEPYSLANFVKTKTYADDFTDIPAGLEKWVEGAFEYGIIVGVGGDNFGAGSNLTIEQAIIIAAKMHGIYAYGDKNTGSADWIDYAKTEGLIGDEFDATLGENATRAEMVYIWSNILTEEDMTVQNEFISIPDVDETHEYYDAIKLAYEVGLLKGVNDVGSFNPDGNILREHAAVIFMKLVEVAERSEGKTYEVEVVYTLSGDEFIQAADEGTDLFADLGDENENSVLINAGEGKRIVVAGENGNEILVTERDGSHTGFDVLGSRLDLVEGAAYRFTVLVTPGAPTNGGDICLTDCGGGVYDGTRHAIEEGKLYTLVVEGVFGTDITAGIRIQSASQDLADLTIHNITIELIG